MTAARRMKAMRERRRGDGLRELRLLVPDVNSAAFRAAIAAQVASLDPEDEREAMDWIERVAMFDEPEQPA